MTVKTRIESLEGIKDKLTAQREFVVWWDQQEKAQGERTDLKPRNGSVTKLGDFHLDKKTVSRWRTRGIKHREKEKKLRELKAFGAFTRM